MYLKHVDVKKHVKQDNILKVSCAETLLGGNQESLGYSAYPKCIDDYMCWEIVMQYDVYQTVIKRVKH